MMSAPNFRISSTGKLLETPPSTNNLPSNSTGAKMEGNAELAIKALAKYPLSKTTCCPVSISVAMHKNGIGNLLKS